MTDASTTTFLSHRSALMALAYRMLGSVFEAEEVVQDVYIKWQAAKQDKIDNPAHWLLKVCNNTALDSLKKAYKKREEYSGTWLPEPLIHELSPWEDAQQSDSLTTAFLLVLEKLKPVERSVFLLREVFDFSYKEIATSLNLTLDNCRKISQRAREKIQSNKQQFDTPNNKDVLKLESFFSAVQLGELEQIQALLDDQAEFWSDGGGKASAVPNVMDNNLRISKFFVGIFQHAQSRQLEYKSELVNINNRQGMILSKKVAENHWEPETVFTFEFANNKIARIYAMRNPDKLTLLRCQSDSV